MQRDFKNIQHYNIAVLMVSKTAVEDETLLFSSLQQPLLNQSALHAINVKTTQYAKGKRIRRQVSL